MALIIKRRFDWFEDFQAFDIVREVRRSGSSGRFVCDLGLTWKGLFRKLFGIAKS